MKLCLLRPDKAGDAIKTLPVLRALKAVLRTSQNKSLGGSSLHVVASTHNESLFRFEPDISVITLPKNWETIPQNDLQNFLMTQKIPERFDKVINLLCDQSETIGLLSSVIHGEFFSITKDPIFNPVHREETENIGLIIDRALGTRIQKCTLNEERTPVFSPDDLLEADKLGKKTASNLWLGLFPLAGTLQRTHPLKKWSAFIRNIQYWAPQTELFIFGGPNDRVQLEEIKRRALSPKEIKIHSASSFRALGACMKRLNGVIAVDSGPLHLSLALGIPSLGFLSGGDSQRWFSRISPKDKLVKRGIFQRYPSSFEMSWAFRRWFKKNF